MVDIKLVRSNPDAVKAAVKKREMDLDGVIDEILAIDEQRRAVTAQAEGLRAQQNAASKKIPQMKKAGEDTTALMAEMKELAEEAKAKNAMLAELEEKQQDLMLSIPNLPDPDLVGGGKENNAPVHLWGEQPTFDFPAKNHVELCESLGLIDYERGAKLAGNGSWVYRGMGARLEWA
ncbi:MAG: serine--tRNA ligase, partial [Clostridia bacterium]|nr:serine--tRNA ligase [Clostridia bacterium]